MLYSPYTIVIELDMDCGSRQWHSGCGAQLLTRRLRVHPWLRWSHLDGARMVEACVLCEPAHQIEISGALHNDVSHNHIVVFE